MRGPRAAGQRQVENDDPVQARRLEDQVEPGRHHRPVIEPGRHEIVVVDDGSTDGSWEIIRQISEEDPRVRAIRFRRNFGKAAALSAGLDAVEEALGRATGGRCCGS